MDQPTTIEDQLAAVTAERDSLVSEVANLKREAVSVEKRAAQIVASCGINALPLGFGGPVKNGPSGSRAEAVAELEQASKEGPEAFAATYARVKDALIGK